MKSLACSAEVSVSERNRSSRRQWADRLTPRELQHAADIELAYGNATRADILSWQAHRLRVGCEVAR